MSVSADFVVIEREEDVGDYVRFSVADTGRGIPSPEIDRIFDRFYRVPRADQQRGTGLGLSISREIVTQHDGEIWVNSRIGSGTQFFFTMPVFGITGLE